MIGELIDSFNSSGIHVINIDARGNDLSSGTLLGYTAATGGGIYGYNFFDGESEEYVGTGVSKDEEKASIRAKMLGSGIASGFDFNFVWWTTVNDLQRKYAAYSADERMTALKSYYPGVLDSSFKTVANKEVPTGALSLYDYWYYGIAQSTSLRLNSFYDTLHRTTYSQYLDYSADNLPAAGEKVHSSQDYFRAFNSPRYTVYRYRYTVKDGEVAFRVSSRMSSTVRVGYNSTRGFFLRNGVDTGAYMSGIKEKAFITDRGAAHELFIENMQYIQTDAPVLRQQNAGNIAEGDRHGWLPTNSVIEATTEGKTPVQEIYDRFAKFQRDYEAKRQSLGQTYLEKPGDNEVFLSGDGSVSSFIEVTYSGTRLDWNLAMSDDYLTLVDGDAVVQTDDTDGQEGDLSYAIIPKGTLITMFVLDQELNQNGEQTGNLVKGEYTYKVSEENCDRISLYEFRDSERNLFTRVNGDGTNNYLFDQRRSEPGTIYVNAADSTGMLDNDAEVARYFFVFDFSDTDDAIKNSAGDTVIHVKPYIAKGSNTAISSNRVGQELANAGIAHIQAARKFEFAPLKSVDITGQQESTLHDNSHLTLNQTVPLHIKTTLTDSWIETYNFEGDTSSQNKDGESLFLDVSFYITNETGELVSLPSGTVATLTLPDGTTYEKKVGASDGTETSSANAVFWFKDGRGDVSSDSLKYNLKEVYTANKETRTNSVPIDVKLDFSGTGAEFNATFNSGYYTLYVSAMRSEDSMYPFSDDSVAKKTVQLSRISEEDVGYTLSADRWQLVKKLFDSSYTGLPVVSSYKDLPKSYNSESSDYELRMEFYRWNEDTQKYEKITDDLANVFTVSGMERREEYYYTKLSAGGIGEIKSVDHTIEILSGASVGRYKVEGSVTADQRVVASDFLVFHVAGDTASPKLKLR